jgi:hypothetical protein
MHRLEAKQKEENKDLRNPHSSQTFHKRKVFTASTSPLTGSWAKYN